MTTRAKLKSIAAAPRAVVPPPLVALSFTPSPAAKAAAFHRGADIAGLLEQLRLALVEVKHALEAMIGATSPDEAQTLRSFLRRICTFIGEASMFAPT
jgi:hypothetical protein